jgi:multiple sugar transport system permease protein
MFLKIMFPLTKPILLTSALFAFILSWKDFIMALNLTSTPNAMTLNVKISAFIQSYSIEYGNMTAAAVIGAVPGLLFAIFAQKYIVSGILSGALKE